MGCILPVLSLFMPRMVMIGIYIATNWFERAFETTMWPILGFLFMPYTTLAYMAGMIQNGDISGGWMILVIVAVMFDLGGQSSSTSSVKNKNQQRRGF